MLRITAIVIALLLGGPVWAAQVSHPVNGPSSSTDGNAAVFSGSHGTQLNNGPPIGTTGSNTLIMTLPTGLLDPKIIPAGSGGGGSGSILLLESGNKLLCETC